MSEMRIDRAMERIGVLEIALRNLLAEVLAAGFGDARDYRWPQVISEAQSALETVAKPAKGE